MLGKGYGEHVAMEGALKLKEMAYLHAEGYSGGALKHGPFALLEVKFKPCHLAYSTSNLVVHVLCVWPVAASAAAAA